MTKQSDMILEYMQQVGEISQLDAFREFGCTRLAARISDLRKDGHAISRRTKKSYNRYGKPVWFAVYKLEASA